MSNQTTSKDTSDKVEISLYEFYVLGITSLLVKSPWELERAVSAYHENFLMEQRFLSLSILLLLGESHVPKKTIKSMPGFEDQIRNSVNQAIFLRALKHYFTQLKLESSRADFALERMQSYITDSRQADASKKDPVAAMLTTMSRRVPPKNDIEQQRYSERVEKIFTYIEKLVTKNLLIRYEITA